MKNYLLIFILMVSGLCKAETLTLLCVSDGNKEYGQIDESLPENDPLRFFSLNEKNTQKFLLTINSTTGEFQTKILGGLDSGKDAAINHPNEENKKFQISQQSFNNVGTYTGYVNNDWFKHKHINHLDRITGILISRYSKTESISRKTYFTNSIFICEKTSPKF